MYGKHVHEEDCEMPIRQRIRLFCCSIDRARYQLVETGLNVQSDHSNYILCRDIEAMVLWNGPFSCTVYQYKVCLLAFYKNLSSYHRYHYKNKHIDDNGKWKNSGFLSKWKMSRSMTIVRGTFFHRIKNLKFCDILLLYRWLHNESS